MRNESELLMRKVEDRLRELEAELSEQTARCMEAGWHSSVSLFWDGRCVERKTLRWVLGLQEKPFNDADVMAGW